MSDHADPLRKGATAHGAELLPRATLSDATSVQSLAATTRMLNARPALVAQRRLAAQLSRAPIQRMKNGDDDAEEWGDFQSAAAQQELPNNHAAAAVNAAAAPNPPAAADPLADQPNPVVVANPLVVAPNPVVAADPPAAAANPVPAANAPAAAAAVAAPAAADDGLKVATGDLSTRNGPMYTTGLVNCVALVAYNPVTSLACLYHWDTINGGLRSEADEDGAEDEAGQARTHFVADQAGVTAARERIDGAVAGAALYHAILGTGWHDSALTPARAAFTDMLGVTFGNIVIAPALHGNARWRAPNLTGY